MRIKWPCRPDWPLETLKFPSGSAQDVVILGVPRSVEALSLNVVRSDSTWEVVPAKRLALDCYRAIIPQYLLTDAFTAVNGVQLLAVIDGERIIKAVGDIEVGENGAEVTPGVITEIDWARVANKPNLVLTVNGAAPDENGNVEVQGGGGEGAILITLDGSRLYIDGKEVSSYSALLDIVRRGAAVLLDTVSGTIAKETLFRPQMVDETAIRFDATGTLGGAVYTRSIALTPKSDGTIAISRGSLTELARSSDIIKDADKIYLPSAINFEPFRQEHLDNRANMTTINLPAQEFSRAGLISKIEILGADTSSGGYSGDVYLHVVEVQSSPYQVRPVAVSSNVARFSVGEYARFNFEPFRVSGNNPIRLMVSRSAENYSDGTLACRMGLVAVKANYGFGIGVRGAVDISLANYAAIVRVTSQRSLVDDHVAKALIHTIDFSRQIYVSQNERIAVNSGAKIIVERGATSAIIDLAFSGDYAEFMLEYSSGAEQANNLLRIAGSTLIGISGERFYETMPVPYSSIAQVLRVRKVYFDTYTVVPF